MWRRFNLPIRDTKIQFDNVTSAQVRYDIKGQQTQTNTDCWVSFEQKNVIFSLLY